MAYVTLPYFTLPAQFYQTCLSWKQKVRNNNGQTLDNWNIIIYNISNLFSMQVE